MENKITIKLRLGSMLLDHFIMCFVFLPPLIVISLIFKSEDPFVTTPAESFAFYSWMLIYLNKDFFRAQSVAKRIVGLQIIDRKTNGPANQLKCFLRNITVPIWPLEAFISLFTPTRRLGDLIANTRVQKAGKENVTLIFEDVKKIKPTHLTLWTFVLSSIYMGILWYGMDRLMNL